MKMQIKDLLIFGIFSTRHPAPSITQPET